MGGRVSKRAKEPTPVPAATAAVPAVPPASVPPAAMAASTGNWAAFEAKMAAAGLSTAAIAAFKKNYDQLVAGVTGMVGC
jgi:hypothetical protein